MFRFNQGYVLPVAGALLFFVGLIGDCLLGLLLWTRGAWQLFGWHFLFALLWSLGVNLITRRGERLVLSLFVSFNKWGTAAFLLGIGTFPGFGVGAYSMACLIMKYGFVPLTRQNKVVAAPEVQPRRPSFEDPFVQNRPVRPLADELQEGDTEARRTVIARISRAATPDTTQLLRQALSDSRAEIRSDASIALSRLDDEMSRVLNISFAAWQANPKDTGLILTLVEQYYEYASSNVLDERCQNTYLVLARDLLLQIVGLKEKQDAQLWLLLARIRQRLGEAPEALWNVHCALQCQPDVAGASLLEMELAFHTHAWDTFLPLAHSKANPRSLQTDESAAFAFVKWWVMPDLALTEREYHG